MLLRISIEHSTKYNYNLTMPTLQTVQSAKWGQISNLRPNSNHVSSFMVGHEMKIMKCCQAQ